MILENTAMKRRHIVSLVFAGTLFLVAAGPGFSAPTGDDADTAPTSGGDDTWSTPPARPGGKIVLNVVSASGDDPFATGKAAAEALAKKMGDAPLGAVIVSECFEDDERKAKLIAGVCSILPPNRVVGGSTYGSFSQQGCSDFDSVSLLGIGGEGVSVSAALVRQMGTSKLALDEHRERIEKLLREAGARLAGKLRKTDQDRLLILTADAHSPKNQFLVEGVQQVTGRTFPITGGSVNKNAGQTAVYFQGQTQRDSAVALMLSGDFAVSLSGRRAKENDAVIRTAHEGAAEALARFSGKPVGVLAFNCAGRRSKLERMEDELTAIQKALGKDLPLFGCYCAGEIGPVDASEKKQGVLSGGTGWHVMFTVIGR